MIELSLYTKQQLGDYTEITLYSALLIYKEI